MYHRIEEERTHVLVVCQHNKLNQLLTIYSYLSMGNICCGITQEEKSKDSLASALVSPTNSSHLEDCVVEEYYNKSFEKEEKEDFFLDDPAFCVDEQFVSKYLRNDPHDRGDGLVFDFGGQAALFQHFHPLHPQRTTTFFCFVDALLEHKDRLRITTLSWKEAAIGNDVVIYLCHRCLENPQLLPRFMVLDLEGNFVTDTGVAALAECLQTNVWPRLHTVRLDEQRQALTGQPAVALASATETTLAQAVHHSYSLLRLSMPTLRGQTEGNQIEAALLRNMDVLRLERTSAHAHHAAQ